MSSWLSFPPPLPLAIPVVVLLFNAGFVGITATVILSRDKQREIQRVGDLAKHDAKELSRSAREHLGPGKTPEDERILRHELDFAGSNPRVRWVLLGDAAGGIQFCSLPGWVGKDVDQVCPEAAAELFRQALAAGGTHERFHSDGLVLAAHAENMGGSPHRTVVMVERDLSASLDALERFAFSDVITAMLLMMPACLGLWMSLRGYLNRRVSALLASTSPMADSRRVPPLRGGDEFAEISRALRESEDRFRQVAENIRDVFYMISTDQASVLYVSPAYEEVWGRPVPSLVATPGEWLQHVDKADRDEVVRHHELIKQGQSSTRVEYRIYRPDGTMRWIENRAFAVRNEKGETYRIAGLAMDVTERKLLEKQLLNASETERRRIGRDLHDDLCQRLAAIKIKCEMLATELRRGGQADLARVDEITARMTEAAALCRGLARTLVPVDITGEGLMVALERLVRTVESLYELPCFFYCPEPVMVESTGAAVHIYRITQEFMNNAIRHGKPGRVDVRMELSQDSLLIEVVNDGLPFAPTDTKPTSENGGMGFKIIHYRASAIGATVRVQPRSDGQPGTIASCLVPLTSCNPDPPSQSS